VHNRRGGGTKSMCLAGRGKQNITRVLRRPLVVLAEDGGKLLFGCWHVIPAEWGYRGYAVRFFISATAFRNDLDFSFLFASVFVAKNP